MRFITKNCAILSKSNEQKQAGVKVNFGFIGAGKVGCTLGKFLVQNGYRVSGYYSIPAETSTFAADFTSSHSFDNLTSLVKDSDIIMLTVPDGVIPSVWQQLLKEEITKCIVCHCSGSLPAEIFTDAEKHCRAVCSVHPLFPVNDRENSYKHIGEAFFTLQGSVPACAIFSELFTKTGIKYKIITAEQKQRYHTAAAMCSNLVTSLYSCASELLLESDFSAEEIPGILTPLMERNVINLSKNGAEGALTGPIERNDTITVRKHLSCLRNNSLEAYKALSSELLNLSQNKYKERDYSEMRELLK